MVRQKLRFSNFCLYERCVRTPCLHWLPFECPNYRLNAKAKTAPFERPIDRSNTSLRFWYKLQPIQLQTTHIPFKLPRVQILSQNDHNNSDSSINSSPSMLNLKLKSNQNPNICNLRVLKPYSQIIQIKPQYLISNPNETQRSL